MKSSLLRFFNYLIFFSYFIGAQASDIDTLKVMSKAMNKMVPNIVITPDHYDAKKRAYPVLYLLHGATDDYTKWTSTVPAILELADQYQMIIVCPDGGYTSWYYDSPVDPTIKYETYITKELITAIDTKYPTFADKSQRAITGLSMGGHGAFYLAFKHQDLFGAAGSMSGGLDILPFPTNWDLPKRLGTYAENKANWEENTVINMTYLLDGKGLQLIFECGSSDFFFDGNQRMHQLLLERNIPHEFTVRPGHHNWNYWSNAIHYQVLYFTRFFGKQKD